MEKEKKTSNSFPNKYLLIFIVFWLGVLTGALAFLLMENATNEAQSNILTTPYSNFQQYIIPTPPGGIISIPTPPGGLTNPVITPGIPTPPGG